MSRARDNERSLDELVKAGRRGLKPDVEAKARMRRRLAKRGVGTLLLAGLLSRVASVGHAMASAKVLTLTATALVVAPIAMVALPVLTPQARETRALETAVPLLPRPLPSSTGATQPERTTAPAGVEPEVGPVVPPQLPTAVTSSEADTRPSEAAAAASPVTVAQNSPMRPYQRSLRPASPMHSASVREPLIRVTTDESRALARASDAPSPNDTGPAETGPNETGPNETGPNETGPNETGPNETGPNDTGPAESARAETEPVEASRLAAETAILQRALDAIAARDTESALRSLRRHARTFPHGVLGYERDQLLQRISELQD